MKTRPATPVDPTGSAAEPHTFDSPSFDLVASRVDASFVVINGWTTG